MRSNNLKIMLRTALAGAALCAATSAQADFIAAIDQFSITRNGGAFFTDTFSNGAPPPSGAEFSYLTFGTTPQPEAGGKYFMDSSLGGYTNAGDGTARLRNTNTVATNNDGTESTLGLKPGFTFQVNGRFDLVATPDARDQYGIALLNSTGPAVGQPTAGQVWSLGVGRLGNGTLGIHLIMQDYTAHTITVIASSTLDTTSGYDQVLLRLDRDNTGNNLAHASFQYWDTVSGVETAVTGFTSVGDATLFQGQQWERAQFFTTQETPVVPVPATLLLLFTGLGLLRFARRA